MSFFRRFFGGGKPDATESRAFVEAYLEANELAAERFLLPDALAEAKSLPKHYVNDLPVHDYEIVEVEAPRVTVHINRSEGVWTHRVVFEVTRDDGELYVRPNLRGEWLDPWQEKRFLSENYELAFVMLPSEDAPIDDDVPSHVSTQLAACDAVLADTVPVVVTRDSFWDDLNQWMAADELTDAHRSELEAISDWVEQRPEPVVGWVLRPRRSW